MTGKMLLLGANWDGIYIGFQLIISRNPDTYHMALWNHFFGLASNATEHPPPWRRFLQSDVGQHASRDCAEADPFLAMCSAGTYYTRDTSWSAKWDAHRGLFRSATIYGFAILAGFLWLLQ